jgi:DNA-binding SARP family transcriptional activator
MRCARSIGERIVRARRVPARRIAINGWHFRLDDRPEPVVTSLRAIEERLCPGAPQQRESHGGLTCPTDAAAAVGMQSEAEVNLTLLDGFTLSHRGRPILLPLRAQRVLGFLAFQHLPVLRPYVAGTLWPDVPERRAAGSLRSALWQLSRLAFRVVDVNPHTLRLAPSVVVDAREAVNWARRVIHGSDADLEGLRFPGELLPDWYDEWLVVERDQLRELRLHALETVAERLMANGRYAEAVEAALTVLRLEPLRDSAHRLLIRLHLAEGNDAAALRHYDDYRQRLFELLGLRPSSEMQGLLRRLTPS